MPYLPQFTSMLVLYKGFVATSPAAVYTAPADTDASGVVLTSMVLHNTGASAETVDVWIVPTGETRGDEWKLYALTIEADATVDFFKLGVLLEALDEIHLGGPSGNSVVAARLSGAVVVPSDL